MNTSAVTLGFSGFLADDGAAMAALRSSANADGDRSRCIRWLAKGLRLHRLSVVAIRCDTMCKAIRGIGVAGGDPVAPGMISKALTSGSFVHDDGATQVFDFGVPPPMWRSGRET